MCRLLGDPHGDEHLAHALTEAGFAIIAGQRRPAELTPADRAVIQVRVRVGIAPHD